MSYTDPQDVCYDCSDLIPDTITAFSRLLSDENKMKVNLKRGFVQPTLFQSLKFLLKFVNFRYGMNSLKRMRRSNSRF